ncbi:MAG: tRNA (adenosine(37)-N6)-threonylcarbamoyltransferase complex ATPase subunit type 1 TsaE [Xanthomonadales bacterium]|nr:tRNA (adenosine(37)-N6)-threonylcarbamoyltransferase complex ATPase subunit type 1 TsaE [Xanthomonadales bacterium]
MFERLNLSSPEETEVTGRRLAQIIFAAVPDSLCIYLHGELGAGKTTFARGFLRGCGHTGRVPSPTYTLVEPYDCGAYQVFHMDLDRLQDGAELEFLGISDMLHTRSIQLIEWPERGAGGLTDADLQVFLKVIPEGRSCELRAGTPPGENILQQWPV